MGNPFGGSESQTAVAIEEPTDEVAVEETNVDTEPDADLDVDGGEGPEDELEEPSKPANVKKTGAAKTKSTKQPVAEGYIAPVAVAKALSKHLTEKARAAGKIADDEEIVIAPQIVYAALKNNGEKSKNPIPQYTDPAVTGGLKSVVKLDEFLAWWDEKDSRVANRQSNVKKTGDKATTETVDTTPAEAPVEAE